MSREWNASAYHRLSDYQFAWGKKVLARLDLRGDERVLDAGCGTGRLTAELLLRLPRGEVAALDLSENMLRTARAHLLPSFGGHVSFVCSDLQRLPFRACFDGVFSTATFHWAQDHPRLFSGILESLKRGGWLVAQCGGGPNLLRLRQRTAEVMSSAEYACFFEDWRDPWEFASAESTRERLQDAGFVNTETWIEPESFELPDEATFAQYLATVTLHRHLERIPDAALGEMFIGRVISRYRADHSRSLDYWRLNMNAIKPA
ncbi:MAG: class I SAM-dependent methyltransferase [Terriglobales bacterium]|jgi:trans-aconitate methyltransferase